MKQTIMIIALAVIVVTAFLWYRSCQDDQIDYWHGKYKEVVVQAELERSQYMKDIEALQRVDSEKDKIIADLNAEIDKTEARIGDKDKQLARLEKEYNDLLPEAEKIDNLQEQIVVYKEKCIDLQNIIEKKDKIIFNLQEKYNAQFSIANDYRALYENELKINDVLKKNLSVLTKKYKVNKTVNAVKNAVILSAAGYITYNLIKDK